MAKKEGVSEVKASRERDGEINKKSYEAKRESAHAKSYSKRKEDRYVYI
jgi:hypothetical protein